MEINESLNLAEWGSGNKGVYFCIVVYLMQFLAIFSPVSELRRANYGMSERPVRIQSLCD